MYSTKNVKKAGTIPPSPKVDGCEMIAVKFPKDKNEKTYITFEFKKKDTGSLFSHSEFELSKYDNETDEKFENRGKALAQRIQHILNAYMPESETEIEEASWLGFLKSVKAKLGEKYKGVEVSLKLTSNSKNYSQFPLFPNFISSEKYPSDFKWDERYDKLTAEGKEETSSSIENDSEEDDPFNDDIVDEISDDSAIDDDFGDVEEEL